MQDDVSRAWLVWSRAVEAALVDAYQFSGEPIPGRGLASWLTWSCFVSGRAGLVVTRCRKFVDNVVDAHDGAGVFLYRHSSIAPFA